MDMEFLWRALFRPLLRPLLLSVTYIAVLASMCRGQGHKRNDRNDREETIDAEYEQIKD